MTAIRPATSSDVDEIVAVHQAAFESFFLTSLGPRFLTRLYRGYLAHPSGLVLVATERSTVSGIDGASQGRVDGDRIAGFVAGTTEPEAFYGWLRRSQGVRLGLAAAPAFAVRPVTVGRRVVAAVRYRGESPQHVAGAALLASLAVDPAVSGRGLGGRLVEAFVTGAHEAGHDLTYCSTDAADNDRVLAFYRRLGFREAERIRRSGGREMAILIRDHAAAPTGEEAGRPPVAAPASDR
jgi:ribosomal protein S18 acetylase RimI-like enzyme